MSTSSNYKLTFNDFDEIVLKSFQNVMTHNIFTDVTLISEDEKHIKVKYFSIISNILSTTNYGMILHF